ncbi:MAG: hypothetical protein HY294_06385 [Candidatus Rokubacteria bacterium]|nr:hypothetical protein [Candidatus Rokubacteria bacterium]
MTWILGRCCALGKLTAVGSLLLFLATSSIALAHSPAEEQAIKDAEKATPVVHSFRGCGAFGDETGDRLLNHLKNRVDVPSSYLTVSIDMIVSMRAPKPIEGQIKREDWREVDTAFVGQFEGAAITVEGYLAGVRPEGAEKTNCGATQPERIDFHIWLVGNPPKKMPNSKLNDRRRAVVVEITPRLRAEHPEWTKTAIQKLVDQKRRVRVSGWLMLDQDHPEQLRKTRGTLWEIHPVTAIEIFSAGQWRALGQ